VPEEADLSTFCSAFSFVVAAAVRQVRQISHRHYRNNRNSIAYLNDTNNRYHTNHLCAYALREAVLRGRTFGPRARLISRPALISDVCAGLYQSRNFRIAILVVITILCFQGCATNSMVQGL
jgi:hypothetical protein